MYKTIFSISYEKLIRWLVSNRKDRKLTIRGLAKLLGIHHSIVGKIETCDRRLDIVEYIQYCEALDINPHEGIRVITGDKG